MVLLSNFLETKIKPTGFFDFIEPLKAGGRIERLDWDGQQYLVKRHTALFVAMPHVVGEEYHPEFDEFIQATLNGTLKVEDLTMSDWVPWQWDDKRPIEYPDTVHSVLGMDEVLDLINKHFDIYKNMLIFKT